MKDQKRKVQSEVIEEAEAAADEMMSEEFCASMEEEEELLEQEGSEEMEDSVKMYLRQIGQYPLLTAEEELELAKRKDAGDLKAKKELVQRNLRLVVSIAKKYRGRGLSFMDLCQEGTMGLITGIDKYSWQQGTRLSTYVSFWVMQAITRSIADGSRVIRVPVHMVEAINKLNKTQRKLTIQLGRDPKQSELAEALEISEVKLLDIQRAARDVASLDTPVGEDGDTTLGDMQEDQKFIDPARQAEDKMVSEKLMQLMEEKLTERERDVLMLRFGLYDGTMYTLEEVGKMYNVTRERIRQIELGGIRKMKIPCHRELAEAV